MKNKLSTLRKSSPVIQVIEEQVPPLRLKCAVALWREVEQPQAATEVETLMYFH